MLKRITLLALLILIGGVLHAQTPAFSEDFEGLSLSGSPNHGSLPTGWEVYDEDGLTVAPNINWIDEAWVVVQYTADNAIAVSTSYYSPAGQSDDWMVTPQISVPSDNPFLFFKDLALDPNYPDNYEILVSETGNTPSDFTDAPIYSGTPNGDFTNRAISLADYAGENVYIAFRNVATDEYILGIDDIVVKTVPNTDLALNSINMHYALPMGNDTIKGTVENMGSETVTSFDVTWTIDGGEEHTETVSGVNIDPLESYDFSLENPWNAQTGDHTLQIAVSNVNGEGADGNSANDELSKDVTVSSGSTQKRVLYEEFTSSYCGPCASWNSTTFTPFFEQLDNEGYSNEYSLVKYQYWIPDADPYFTNECFTRGQYYQINADPTMIREGARETYGNAVYLNDIPPIMHDQFLQTLEEPALFGMDITASYNNTNVDVTVNSTPYISGNYTLYVAIVEKTTTGNVGSNGETQFEQVMMKMLPDANGTPINFVDGQEDTHTFSIDLSQPSITSGYSVGNNGPYNGQQMAPHVEDYNDLQVVAWIQNDDNHRVFQSATSNINLGVNSHDDELANISIYPNPSNGMLHLKTKTPVNVTITNILGVQVFAQNGVDSSTPLNINNLSSGIYMVTISQKNKTTTKKLIVK